MPFATAHAADAPRPWYIQNPFAWIVKVYDDSNPSEIFGERYTAAQVQWIIGGLVTSPIVWLNDPARKAILCVIGLIPESGGVDISSCTPKLDELFKSLESLSDDSSTPNLANSNPILNSIGQNPISGIGYTKDLIAKFNPITEVNAQGFGYTTSGNLIKTLWQATRNISYMLLVLAVIVMAFMIMFRVKLSPQVVISVQSALPNIIFTTILITFSYAIAGFVIDLMYVVIGLIASLLVSSGFTGNNFIQMFGDLNNAHSAFSLMYGYWIMFVVASISTIVASISSFVMAILVLLFSILSIFAIIFWSIKIIYMLLKNFALVVLTIATGPLEILVGAFTGKSTFGSWLKKLISHLAVYPILGVIFFFSFFFLRQGSGTIFTGRDSYLYGRPAINMIVDNSWLPPFSGFALGDNILWVVVSFVIFSNATKVVEIIQGMITGKGFGFGTGIGETFGRDNFVWGNTGAPVIEGVKKARSEAYFADQNNMINTQINKILERFSKKSG